MTSGLDLTERVTLLQHSGFSDQQILDALLDPADPELERVIKAVAATAGSTNTKEGH